MPAKSARLLTLLGNRIEVKLGSYGEKNVACVATGNQGQLICLTIAGSFPNYRQLIPDEAQMTTTVTVQSKELAQGLSMVGDIVYFYPHQDNSIRLVTKDGNITKECLCPATVSGDGRIAINRKYLLDLTKLSDTITLSWDKSNESIRAVTQRGTHVIMPMFLQEA
jgi:DNA polymerase III sliding clamp (beta) subunit (PCNA family)